ncbi:hypothetical protein RRF68_02450 [Tenacibaculum sp. HL-MS23]|uniref:hypothetical protein n=1 Tax=Tenacibaculum sp. HL-MS23 TaxID=3077734 RepID=UPI0028FC2246|nr:hypothetical protein [Tenacibaculum sp. HL-MS23]WNW02303.1 hypothetical protein RRF68_02450 [Tenacibaculum sp. HL-MS23]
MKSIFFIRTSLEMLGAIEARKQFGVIDTLLIIKSDRRQDSTINFLIKKSEGWNNIIRTKKKTSYGISWLKLVKKLNKEKYKYLFTRAFPIASYFVNNLNYEKLYILDDGAATIAIAKEYKNTGNLTKRFSLFKGKNKVGFKYDLVQKIYASNKIKIDEDVTDVNFFTFYNLPDYENNEYVQNNFTWLHSLKNNSKKENSNKVYLIGTAVVDSKILLFEDYFTTLKRISEFYKDKEIVYVPHKREDSKELKTLEKELNFNIRRNKFNIELDFLLNNEFPTHVTGTISTALIILKGIYKESEIDFFNFDDSKIIENKKKVIIDVYKYQEKYINYNRLNY